MEIPAVVGMWDHQNLIQHSSDIYLKKKGGGATNLPNPHSKCSYSQAVALPSSAAMLCSRLHSGVLLADTDCCFPET